MILTGIGTRSVFKNIKKPSRYLQFCGLIISISSIEEKILDVSIITNFLSKRNTRAGGNGVILIQNVLLHMMREVWFKCGLLFCSRKNNNTYYIIGIIIYKYYDDAD